MTFELKPHHIILLGRARVRWAGGAPAIDGVQPYGDYDVARTICWAIGWPEEEYDHEDEATWSAEQSGRALEIHRETETALQIILACRTFEPGVYERVHDEDPTSWRRKEA